MNPEKDDPTFIGHLHKFRVISYTIGGSEYTLLCDNCKGMLMLKSCLKELSLKGPETIIAFDNGYEDTIRDNPGAREWIKKKKIVYED
jgi:hypothetical protein